MPSAPPFRRHRQGCRGAGFSLLETMFALLVLGISIAVLAGSLVASMRADSQNHAANAALFLAQQEAEQIVAQYRAMGAPCAPASCGSFTDANQTTVSLDDNLTAAQVTAGQSIPAPSFASPATSGYSETVWVGNNCQGPGSGCQQYQLRWNIYTPTGIGYAVNGASASGVQLAHLICVAARAVGGAPTAPEDVYAAAP